MKTLECRKLIQAALETLDCSVYYGQADEAAVFPYAIFSVESVNWEDFVERAVLEINFVGYGRNTAEIENLCDSAMALFDHTVFSNDDVALTSYFEAKNIVNSEDRKIIRRRMLFYLNIYDKEMQ